MDVEFDPDPEEVYPGDVDNQGFETLEEVPRHLEQFEMYHILVSVSYANGKAWNSEKATIAVDSIGEPLEEDAEIPISQRRDWTTTHIPLESADEGNWTVVEDEVVGGFHDGLQAIIDHLDGMKRY